LCSNTPVDVIKTRMQGLSADKYKSVWDCALQIAKHEVRPERARAP
jgi:solute carrier family 25 citrate transporter 1